MTYRTRFAPSPTGPLHLGHAYSALLGAARAEGHGGEFLLRIEDLDRARSRETWEAQIHEDLTWLGVCYPRPVLRQSERLGAYQWALDALWAAGLLYPCTCKRRDIEAAVSAPQEGAPMHGPDGLVYPGTCRKAPSGPMPDGVALRLNMALALDHVGPPDWIETGAGPRGEHGHIGVSRADMLSRIGDIAVRRPQMGAAYHLAVVVDDAFQGITEVVRGEDLFDATAIHVVLQRLLGSASPQYHHHRLVRDETGKRLAKRHDARAIRTLLNEGSTPDDILELIGLDPPKCESIK
ncbi:MAG: tRNA glutamyl-Q(34) synthetase GluQRS [Pseudomonadota bacterium]